MGSPLEPLFANIFMSEFERKHMNKLKELGIRIWKRYVDDIFVTASNETQCMNALVFYKRTTCEHGVASLLYLTL